MGYLALAMSQTAGKGCQPRITSKGEDLCGNFSAPMDKDGSGSGSGSSTSDSSSSESEAGVDVRGMAEIGKCHFFLMLPMPCFYFSWRSRSFFIFLI